MAKKKLLSILLVFLCMVFPITGHMGVLFAQTLGDISGTVIGADGKPLRGVEVRVIDINTDKIIASAKTDKDGSFSFGGLKAGQTYKVEALHGKDVSSVLVAASAAPSKPVALRLSKTKGVQVLAAAGKGFPTWGYVLIGVGVVGGAVGGAAAAGAFEGKKRRPVSP
jgi:hypothetical protein